MEMAEARLELLKVDGNELNLIFQTTTALRFEEMELGTILEQSTEMMEIARMEMGETQLDRWKADGLALEEVLHLRILAQKYVEMGEDFILVVVIEMMEI